MAAGVPRHRASRKRMSPEPRRVGIPAPRGSHVARAFSAPPSPARAWRTCSHVAPPCVAPVAGFSFAAPRAAASPTVGPPPRALSQPPPPAAHPQSPRPRTTPPTHRAHRAPSRPHCARHRRQIQHPPSAPRSRAHAPNLAKPVAAAAQIPAGPPKSPTISVSAALLLQQRHPLVDPERLARPVRVTPRSSLGMAGARQLRR
ncbi:hypothetical protein PHLGIDRAFT_113608 [Phlebiopsis gigantea 11061_1 CR5-6]|uniref:Uncharacterized protein n=1 Tax=Phlebiopsis gigantea (strain 11061_1 CR5-6) TaxID=745531 RepID=A0A0C3S7M5_PHLG1|nr:hypothetical protein PHLGIDRAFT_113608 [Phlebiopsis gigantea 11061_1 CR5-6]